MSTCRSDGAGRKRCRLLWRLFVRIIVGLSARCVNSDAETSLHRLSVEEVRPEFWVQLRRLEISNYLVFLAMWTALRFESPNAGGWTEATRSKGRTVDTATPGGPLNFCSELKSWKNPTRQVWCWCFYRRRQVIAVIWLQRQQCVGGRCFSAAPTAILLYRVTTWKLWNCNVVSICVWSVATTTVLRPFSGTTRVSRCQKRTSGLYGARGD